MIHTFKRIFVPLSYLWVRRQGKLFEECGLPLLMTLLTLAAVLLAGDKFSVYGTPGLIASITSYLQLLSGFFITALAAIATFNREGMDDEMLGDPPTLERGVPERLSRRRFLCFLFGYLAFGSIALYIAGTIITLSAPALLGHLSQNAILALRWSVLTVYLFCTFNILITSLLGMYYLTDKLHRPLPAKSNTEVYQEQPRDEI
ncbi:hypothetical protein CWR53_03520 [Pseudomonas sp. SGAir0191]|uniref:hypothetical protein n=1 Tax=Pseudomonas sp. SGAir0191 TaxID=2217867 RepID=UPI000C2CB284|nr:hypothetical protein [Pseudomonas sp. SGAir0191]AUA31728.1 hypothetical protein CWR53_03520 [Pseudomonas sp. SGAir0191]